MAAASELAQLYEVVYGKPPRPKTMLLLKRMETILGLSQDDPLARMLILNLRIADHNAESFEDQLNRFKKIVDDAQELNATSLIAAASARAERPTSRGYSPLELERQPMRLISYQRASPLWSYLRDGLLPRGGILDDDERTVAARYDLFIIAILALLIYLAGFALGRWH